MEQTTRAFENYWAKNRPKRYMELEIPLKRASTEVKLSRFTLGKLYAARSGHGDFAAYHSHLKHEDAECYCRCGHSKTPEHFYYCTLSRKAAKLRRPIYNLRETLATSRGALEFDSWLRETAFYQNICPMRRRAPPDQISQTIPSSVLLPSSSPSSPSSLSSPSFPSLPPFLSASPTSLPQT
ncbi:hypothetical protein GX48_08176 [Paracoccidioides brasiliensis]|nr:hypothetical protein GX48_08176 [Paracoccidioides brasiliensis]